MHMLIMHTLGLCVCVCSLLNLTKVKQSPMFHKFRQISTKIFTPDYIIVIIFYRLARFRRLFTCILISKHYQLIESASVLAKLYAHPVSYIRIMVWYDRRNVWCDSDSGATQISKRWKAVLNDYTAR